MILVDQNGRNVDRTLFVGVGRWDQNVTANLKTIREAHRQTSRFTFSQDLDAIFKKLSVSAVKTPGFWA